MTSKVVIIIATGDRKKALTGLMYAQNAIKHNWLNDVKIIYFGPSERLLTIDEEVREAVKTLAKSSTCYACKFLSDQDEISDAIADLGVKVEYVGTILSNLIEEGYIPMVW
jgi:hypothetical protein